MLFRILLRYILGYVNISVEGYYIERFINICLSKNILIWNVKKKKSTFMRANVGIQDFKRLKEVSKKTKCKMKIDKKRGIPFLMNRYRKRKIFVIFLFAIMVLMIATSKFVWNIEIEGLDTIPESEIINNLSECGLSVRSIKKQN